MVKAPPRWLHPTIIALAAVVLAALFTREISDFDFWWTLKSGQYIAQKHTLPSPDPFAFTTALARDTYAGESVVRHFNLTFEWLAQLIFYGVYSLAGFSGIVVFRALLLGACCGMIGWIAWLRCGGFNRAVAAALLAAWVLAVYFTNDRSYLFTFFFLAVTLTVLESRRRLWLLPAIGLLWANCHGGFFLQWVAAGAYCMEAWWQRRRGRGQPGDRTLWIASAACVAASAINPNGFRVLQVLAYFRGSFLQSKLVEWRAAALWPPNAFNILLVLGVVTLLWARARTRVVDWLLFSAFAAAGLMAQRNVFLVGFWAPVILASYIHWKRAIPVAATFAAAAALVAGLAICVGRGQAFQFRVAEWRFPSGAADFLIAHGVSSRIFNTYETGGYLIWRLWPQEKVFIDGRALSESVFNDYARILYNHSNADGGPTAQELLDRYTIQAIVMNGFEYSEGITYNLMLSLSNPQTKWKLVYSDAQAVVFMREPPPGVPLIPGPAVFDHLEAECALHLEREPQFTLCSRALGQVFAATHDYGRARKWLGYYLSVPHEPDPEADAAYRAMLSQ
jgi:hypothetical protein